MSRVHTVVWQRVNNVGLEYLSLVESSSDVVVNSVIIGIENAVPFRLHYGIQCDTNYQVQQLALHLIGRELLILTTDGAGHWFDTHNHPLPHLDGCIDIDITATPFTNTLPIRRLEWQAGQSRSFNMVYIRIPEFTIERAAQQYTCLERNTESSLFEYAQPGFRAILPVDADGFVQNYPELFRRLS